MTEKKKLTAEEKAAVQKQIDDLQASLADQEQASGAAAQADADEEVEEQRERLATLFDRLGLSEEDFDLMATAFATGTEQRTRSIVREVLAEEEEAAGTGDDDKGGTGDDGGLGAASDDPKVPPVKPDAAPEPAPQSEHWTKKKIFGRKEEDS